MPRAVAVLAEAGQRWRQQLNQGRRERGPSRVLKNFRQAAPGCEVRQQGQAVIGAKVFDGPDGGERGMRELVQPVDPLAQCRFEVGIAAELGPESQQLERRRAAVVEHQQSIAEFVRRSRGVPTGEGVVRGARLGEPVGVGFVDRFHSYSPASPAWEGIRRVTGSDADARSTSRLHASPPCFAASHHRSWRRPNADGQTPHMREPDTSTIERLIGCV